MPRGDHNGNVREVSASGLARIALIAVATLAVTTATQAQPRGIQDDDVLAPELSPYVCKAKAVREGDAVVIRLTYPETVLTPREPEDDKSKGWSVVWTTGDPLTLGQHIQAYRRSGEQLTTEAVLNALEQSVAVACFERKHKDDPLKPDPFYTSAFRDDIVILVYDGKYWLRE